ncbi:glutamate--tRNA ligase [Labrys monachus]|uniref:Glutamate--tRNA ligase n=1 Tax=Labrys monachus TaxID=217067 RepID=A0ABU0FIV5_9HYPH|nr:glutamate--tRNA ligase [Labrys monachus]MDQ0394262.1 glutamyl-tRNA synthetase [Labrys monachus]
MPPVVRFAPSPTGYIHIGNIRTALLNWCVAKRDGGRFILRYDDTDRERSREEYATAIAIDLAWLGMTPDLAVRQSQRMALYDAAAAKLRAAGLLYPCYESEDELERRRRRQMARGLPPVYDRAALRLTAEQKAAFEAEGRRRHWRFLLDHRNVSWEDGVRGHAHVDTASLSDPVLIRADGGYLYTLPSVVDDIDLGVTHIIRGEDHVTNTAVQIEIFEALGGAVPAFAHHNLLTTASGEGLSKRSGALSIGSLREAGFEPMAVASLAVLTGTAEAVRPVASLAALAGLVDLSRISRAPARFDPAEIETLNARLLHETPYAEVAARLEALGVGGGEAFWLAVRSNVVRLADAKTWWDVVTGPVQADAGDGDFLARAAALLPPEPWTEGTWSTWTDAVKAETGAKGKALFMPLRRALTGLDHGPELKTLLPLIGRARALARLGA